MAPDVDATAGTPKGWHNLEAVLAEGPVAALLATYLGLPRPWPPGCPGLGTAWTGCARPRCPQAHQPQPRVRFGSCWTSPCLPPLGQLGVQKSRGQLKVMGRVAAR